MIARALLAVTTLAPTTPAQDGPLEVISVDTAAYPTVVIELVAPVQRTARRLTTPMVEVNGSAVESVTPVDPRDVVVGLVIDDRPDVAPEVVTALQGAAMELVRLTRDGIEISLGTPSGLRTALTSDRNANTSRIAAITAGSPAVVRLPAVLVDTAVELASSTAADRHAVVVLGSSVAASAAQLAELADALAESGTTLHVVAPANVELGPFARLARSTGGIASTSPEVLASVDAVTATISNRYRVVARVDEAGRHRVRLTVDGQRFSAGFDVSAPSATGEPLPSEPAAADVQGPTPSEAGTIAEPVAPDAPLDVTRAREEGGLPVRTIGLIAVVLGGILLAAGIVVVILRRRGGAGDNERVVVKPPAVTEVSPTPPPEPAVPAPSTPTPKPVVGPSRRKASVTPLARRPTRSSPPRPAPLRRVAPTPPAADASGWIVAGDLRMFPARREVWCGNRKVELSASEFGVLELLLTSGGRGVTREAIIEAGQLDESDGPDAVDAIVAQVRRKTGVRGRGRAVRKERVVMYFLEGADTDPG